MANYRNDFADVNLETGAICRNFMNHTIGSGDALGDRFGVRVFRNGEPVSLGGTCAGYFVRNTTGETVVISSGVVSGNEAYVTLPAACYAVEGSFTLAIKVTSGSETVTMRIIDGVVSRTNTSVTVDPGTLVPSIETLISAINSAVGQIPVNYNASFAPAYSESSTYAVGDYVVYDGYLWRCTTAITETETWTAAHWKKVALASDVSDLKSAITYKIETITDYETGKYINNNADVGQIASLTYNNSDSYMCLLLPVCKGDSVMISGMGGNAARLWCLVDKNNVVIKKSDANYTATNEIVNITVNGKLACDFYTSVTATVVLSSGVLGIAEKAYDTIPVINGVSERIYNDLGGTIVEDVALVPGYIDYSNGSFSNYDTGNKYRRSDYIEIPNGCTTIKTNCVGNASGGWAVYNSSKQYITGAQTTEISVQDGYKFIAVSSFESSGIHSNKTVSFIRVSGFQTTIACWGDSITEGMYLDGNHSAEYGKAPYPAQITTLLTDNNYSNFIVYNYGHGGECMPDISARLGSVCAYFIEDVTIPGDGTAVQIGTHDESGGLRTNSKIQIPFNNKNGGKYNVAFTQIAYDTNPITINGDKFTLSISSQKIYLSQTSGSSITIPAGSLVFTNDNRNSTIDIVYGGVNDGASMTLELYLKFIEKVAVKNPKYLCIGCQNALFQYWSDVQGSTIAEKHSYYADACNSQMGVHFVDLYNEFYSVALKYALEGGYFTDKTQTELNNMQTLLNQKTMPAEFSYDGAHQGNVHLNAAGYYVMARIIVNRLKALNYI